MSWDDPFKRMQELMDPFRELRKADPHRRMEEIFRSQRLDLQIPDSSAIGPVSVDLTQEIRNLVLLKQISGVERFRTAALDLGLHERLAAAAVDPLSRSIVSMLEDQFNANASLAVAEGAFGLLQRLKENSGFSSVTKVRFDESVETGGDEEATAEEEEGDRSFDLDGDEDETSFEELELPEAIHQALRRVEYIPLQVHRKIIKDQSVLFELTSRQFEEYVADLISGLGFKDVILTQRSGDGGRDLVAVSRIHGIPLLFAFECKRYAPNRPIGPEILRALLGTVKSRNTAASMGVLVTTSHFTKGSNDLLITEPCLDGKDFDQLAIWIERFARETGLK